LWNANYLQQASSVEGGTRAELWLISMRLLPINWLYHFLPTDGKSARPLPKNPALLHYSVGEQLRRLILEPYITNSLSEEKINVPSTSQQPFLVIIDGLDECQGNRNQCTVLEHVAMLVNAHYLPLTFLIASRPEPHIVDAFTHRILPGITCDIFLESLTAEIRVFLVSSFDEIRWNHPLMRSVPLPWPSHDEMSTLVQRFHGYFIYFSTVLKFIDNQDTRPTEQLALVLSGIPGPFAEIDQLYHQILSSVANPALLIRVLGYIFISRQHLSTSVIEGYLASAMGSLFHAAKNAPPIRFSGRS
jgi:hypothetical protein